MEVSGRVTVWSNSSMGVPSRYWSSISNITSVIAWLVSVNWVEANLCPIGNISCSGFINLPWKANKLVLGQDYVLSAYILLTKHVVSPNWTCQLLC